MRDRLDELGDTTEVALITFTEPERLAEYDGRHQFPFAMLTDRDRSGYRSYGLGRGSWLNVWGIKAAKRYLEVLWDQGFSGLRPPVEDSRQLGGNFVVGPDGRLLYGYWGDGPHERPRVDEIIAAVP